MDARSDIVPETVVLVDDDPALLDALSFSLGAAGYRVLTFESAEAVLSARLPDHHACLVLDQRLPGRSGMDALSELRRRGHRLPAIFITSHPKPEFRRSAARAGAVIVEKPLLQDSLLGAVRRALDVTVP